MTLDAPIPLPQREPGRRGAALLLVLVIIGILSMLAFALVQMGSSETDAVGAKRRYDKAVSCTDAARQLLLSQFRTYGTTPTQMAPMNVTLDDQILATGHYDQIAVTGVSPASGMSSGGLGVTDMSNRIMRSGLGGQVYRITVVCTSAAAGTGAPTRQSEVEYLVRFGI